MKIGIVITLFNRPKCTSQCFEYLKRAKIPHGTLIVLIDDGSKDRESLRLFESFTMDGCTIHRIRKEVNRGVKDSIKLGSEYCFNQGCDLVVNLDNDAIVNNEFMRHILYNKKKHKGCIVTGFNCNTLNRDGSQRHFNLGTAPGAVFKKSVGGINMCYDKAEYEKYLLPALNGKGNWDHQGCINSEKAGKHIVACSPSVVQHLCEPSAMGHNEPPDVAEDFKPLSLYDVTLIGASCNDFNGLAWAASISTRHIHFGAVKLLTSAKTDHPNAVKIPKLSSKAAYNQFVLKEMVNYVDTDYFLIIQPDGFIINHKAWSDEFYKYDFIGSLWHWYKDEFKNGNGGFSFRSKRLHEILRDDKNIIPKNDNLIKNLEEDHVQGRIYRKYLEEKHNIKFAPDHICEQFSIEAYGQRPPANKYKGSFGFHSTHVDFNRSGLDYVPYTYPNYSKKIKYA
jgi:hypothetical protein